MAISAASLSQRLRAIAKLEPSQIGPALELVADLLAEDERRKASQRSRTKACRERKAVTVTPCNVTVTHNEQNQIVNPVTVTLQPEPLSYLCRTDDVKIDDVKTDDSKIDDSKIHMYNIASTVPVKTLPVENGSKSHFEVFWEAFPHKIGKGYAAKCFIKAHKKASLQEMLDGIDRYVTSKSPDIPWCNPSTWLNQERWLDQPSQQPNNQLFGKKLTYRQATHIHNTGKWNNAVSAAEAAANAARNLPALGSPPHKTIPTSGKSGNGRIHSGNGKTDGGLF